MTKCTVLKQLTLSTDGINQITFEEGDTPDVPDRLIAGLKADGYLEPPQGWVPPKVLPKGSVPAKAMTPPGPASAAPVDVTALQKKVDELVHRVDALEAAHTKLAQAAA
jgi:hypothetical protein